MKNLLWAAGRLFPLLVLAFACGGSDASAPDIGKDVPTDMAAVDLTERDLMDDVPSTDLPLDLRPPPDVDQLLEEGRFWLINAEPAFALDAFKAVLEAVPDHPDALFGAGLSQYVLAVETFAMILTLPTQFGAYGAGDGTSPSPFPKEPESQNDYLAQEVHNIMLFLHSGFAEAEGYFQRIDDPNFTWTIEQVPIYVFTRPVLNLRGTFDRADIYLLQSSNAFFLWFTELLAAQDFHTDLLTAVYGALKARDEGVDLLAILDIVATLMASDERFFALHETDGLALFEAGHRHMREAGEFLLRGLQEQPDIAPEEGQALSVVYGVDGPVLYVNERVDFHTQIPEVLAIEFEQPLITATEVFLERMETPGDFVPFSQSGALQLGTVLGFATKLDLLQFMPVTIPIDLSNLEPAQVVSLLSLFLNDAIALDYGTFMQAPAGLRSFFPLLVKVPEPSSPDDYWMEWECPDDISEGGTPQGTGKFLCSDTAELVDGPHFEGTPFEIPADDVASPLPYMVWEDPTWSGLLGVDELFAETSDGPASYISPDLFWTNLAIRSWASALLGLL